jgi:hypothetical protein
MSRIRRPCCSVLLRCLIHTTVCFNWGLFLFEQNIASYCDETLFHPREREGEGEGETATKPHSRRLFPCSPIHRFRERIGCCPMCVTYPSYTSHSTYALHTNSALPRLLPMTADLKDMDAHQTSIVPGKPQKARSARSPEPSKRDSI